MKALAMTLIPSLIVRQLAVKYQHTENVKEILAVTDGLARHPDGQRGNCRLDLRFIREDAIPGDVLDLPYSGNCIAL